MSNVKTGFIAMGIMLILSFICGFGVGAAVHEHSVTKEITELSIELTTLNIKKLKGECNES